MEDCKIKSKEEFIQACENEGISRDWYSFSYDKTKPLSFGRQNDVWIGVYNYGFEDKFTSNPANLWDIAFEEIKKIKKEYDWQRSGQQFKIDYVSQKSKYVMSDKKEYPYVILYKTTFTKEEGLALVKDEWIFKCYDPYMGHYVYNKTVDIRTNMTGININFTKRTDKRDIDTFGFSREFMLGNFCYPIPDELMDELSLDAFEQIENYDYLNRFSEKIKEKLTELYKDRLLDDEYNALKKLKDEFLNDMPGVIDPALTVQNQRNAFSDLFFKKCRSFDLVLGSRYAFVYNRCMNTACSYAGIDSD